MDIDPTYLTLSLLFGTAGMGLFIYGKKACRIPHLVAGVGLMTCPYFLTNIILMSLVCLAVGIAPFMLPEG